MTPTTAIVPPLGPGEVQVWWAGRGHAYAHLDALLDPVERERRAAYRQAADRDRFSVGVAVSRLVAGAHLGRPPGGVAIDRTCPTCGAPHGRPRVGGGLELSVSHAHDLVVVAVVRDRRVGVDVERADRTATTGVRDVALSPAENAVLDRLPEDARAPAFFRYWVRKEAVLKAAGVGLAAPMADLTVSAPGDPPAVLEWRGRTADTMTVTDLVAGTPGAPVSGYLAALAVTGPPAIVVALDAAQLLAG